MKFPNFNYKGQVFDLSHLVPFYCEYIHPASASSDEKIYRCIVEFSGHCFTKSPNQRKGETLASYESELHYSLATETRIFCFERHRYSLQLPQIIKELANRKCFFTSADDKFLTIEVQNEEGKTVDYEIYFSLKKSKEKQCDIHLFINSAYIRSDDYKPVNHPIRRKSISFFVLLHNTLTNKRIKKPC